MESMKYLLIFILIPILTSCQVIGTGVQVIGGSIGCSVNNNPAAKIEQGSIRNISIDLSLSDGENQIILNETAVCEYQGSMCAGGTWFQVWYGDQSIFHKFKLADGNTLKFGPHNFCTNIDFYEKKCISGNCNPSEHFTLSLSFSEELTEKRKDLDLDWNKGEFTGFESVNESGLIKFGYKVNHYLVDYGEVAYNKPLQ
jgi:hypothetical protein